MRNFIFLLVALVFSFQPAIARNSNKKNFKTYEEMQTEDYYTIAKVIIQPVEIVKALEKTGSPLLQTCEQNKAKNLDFIDEAGVVDITQIFNIGKKIWDLVNAGKPVVEMNTNVAHALPAGIGCWLDLDSWQLPQSKAVKVTYLNRFGMIVVDFTYRLSFVYGGQFNGKGKYITEATVLPADLFVAWGFKFNALAEIPIVFNTGTKENPIAAMQVNVKWSVDSPIAHHESVDSFAINGLGEITPFAN